MKWKTSLLNIQSRFLKKYNSLIYSEIQITVKVAIFKKFKNKAWARKLSFALKISIDSEKRNGRKTRKGIAESGPKTFLAESLRDDKGR